MRLIILAIVITISSCTPTATIGSQNNAIEALAQAKLGGNAVIINNKDNTFTLCYKELPGQSISYLIVRLSDTKLVVEDKVSPTSSISWRDNFHVEIKIIPGTIKKTEEEVTSKIIDVSTYLTTKQ
jgi:hypothetical protein